MEIESKGVSVTLSGREIVHRVSVQVKDRQFVGLLGPNGSGKTTLLKSIYRVLKPSEGAVCIDGEDIRRMSYRESAKRTGVVSQFTSMSFDFSVEEMVLMGRAPHKTALSRDTEEDYRIAEEALRRVDMLEILVLDEPTNHLDIKYQIQIMDVVKSLGVGVLAALHDLNLTLMYCDYVYVLKNGSVVAEGPTEDVITEALIRRVYEVDCSVQRHPKTGKLHVVFFPGSVGKGE